jgi:hypothetical protein
VAGVPLFIQDVHPIDRLHSKRGAGVDSGPFQGLQLRLLPLGRHFPSEIPCIRCEVGVTLILRDAPGGGCNSKMRMFNIGALIVSCLITSHARSQCEGTWVVNYANSDGPIGDYDSEGTCMSGQIALGLVGSNLVAWPDPSGLWQDIRPTGAAQVGLGGASATTFVGSYSPTTQANLRACYWSSVPGSLTSLHKSNWYSSGALGVSGIQQVGAFNLTSTANSRACLWNGSSASFVDLHPPAAVISRANGTNGVQQIGTAVINDWAHACLWSGSVASMIDLTPPGVIHAWGQAISGSQQAGSVQVKQVGYPTHAAVWYGSRESFIDLNPPGCTNSHIMATCGSHQVGQATVNGVNSAYLWRTSAQNGVDLQALTVGFNGSRAEGVSVHNGTIYVCGWGNTPAGRRRAVIWVFRDGADCDSDGVADRCEIEAGAPDINHNDIPDSCECLGDILTDGRIDGADLGAVLSYWGPVTSSATSQACDIDNNGIINGADLGLLLSSWGPCR